MNKKSEIAKCQAEMKSAMEACDDSLLQRSMQSASELLHEAHLQEKLLSLSSHRICMPALSLSS